MNLIIFSHTDYSFLWPIIEECINKIPQLNPIFVSNKTTLTKPSGFIKYIEYDANLCYSKRWTNDILPHIDNAHILVVHDIHVIANCNVDFINKIVRIMQENNIDRCSLNVFNGENIIENDHIKLCNLNSAHGNTFTPYDVCPAIWKTTSFKQLFDIFSNETYRTSELNGQLQLFCRENFRCFGLQKTDEKIYYCLGRAYLESFQILFITIHNEITFPIEVYMDMKSYFVYFFEKYNLKNKVRINNNYDFILKNFKCI